MTYLSTVDGNGGLSSAGTFCRVTVGVAIKCTNRTYGTATIYIVYNLRSFLCTVDGHRGVTLHKTSIKVSYAAYYKVTLIIYLSFTATIYVTVSVAIATSAFSTNETSIDNNLGITTDTRFFSAAIDTLCNSGCAVYSKDGFCNFTKAGEFGVSVNVMFATFFIDGFFVFFQCA